MILKFKILALLLLIVIVIGCNRNKHDTINKTSKIDSGKNAEPDSNIRLRLDSADRDSSNILKDSLQDSNEKPF